MALAPLNTSKLCLSCGFCCNGALFRDVEIQPGEQVETLLPLSQALRMRRGKACLPQPCPALGKGNRCEVYAERPQHCRTFECVLFQDVAGGRVELDTALRTVASARQLLARILRRLEHLGDTRDDLPVLARFQRTMRRLERGEVTPDQASQFAELGTLFHKWQLLLRRRFFP